MGFNQVLFAETAIVACELAQVEYREPKALGRPVRSRALNKSRNNLDGSIIYFGLDNGVIFNWVSGVTVYFFPGVDGEQSEEKKREFQEKAKALQSEYRSRIVAQNVAASSVAVDILMASRGANRAHGYLVKKSITFAHRYLRRIPKREALQYIRKGGILNEEGRTQSLGGLTDNLLVVPVQNAEGETTSIQFIDENGNKRFLLGGAQKGCYWSTLLHTKEGKTSPVIGICEGVATALSLYHQKQIPVIASFSANNLQSVAVKIRELYPNRQIIIFADRDPSGVGVNRAQETARALGACALVKCPTFSEELTARYKAIHGAEKVPTDYNDLYALLGVIE